MIYFSTPAFACQPAAVACPSVLILVSAQLNQKSCRASQFALLCYCVMLLPAAAGLPNKPAAPANIFTARPTWSCASLSSDVGIGSCTYKRIRDITDGPASLVQQAWVCLC